MASENAFKHFRYAEKQAFLKWKRTFIRSREQHLLKELSDVDMPAWKKRRLVREMVYYAGCSDFQPLTGLGTYDYTPEDDLRMSETPSYGFVKSDITGSSPAASSIAKHSTTGPSDSVDDNTSSRSSAATSIAKHSTTSPSDSVENATRSRSSASVESPQAESVDETAHKFFATTGSRMTDSSVAEPAEEEVDEASTSQATRLTDSSPKESEFATIEEWTVSNQSTPERSRRNEDCSMDILNLSPALSALKINHETAMESEAEELIEDFANHTNVRFFKRGKLNSSLRNRLSFTTIYKGTFSGDFASLKPVDEFEMNASSMLLVPSNVQPEVQELALEFADHFGYRVADCDAKEGSLDERVSHVLVDLEAPEPLQFAQCQAVGCRRYLVAPEWLRDSLTAERVLPEDPFELIFWNEDTGAKVDAPSRVARLWPRYLFDGFAILMCKPFVDFKESEMKQLLIMNGARICEHPRELKKSSNQARVCIVDPTSYWKGHKRELLKLKSVKYKFVAVDYNWLFHSLIMYQVRPLLRYLHDAELKEALEAGVPVEFLKD